MKHIQTTRFGIVNYDDEHLITFPDGMVGFHQLKTYVLVESPQNPLILWLQSTDHSEIAFPVVEPWFFKTDYKAHMTEGDKITISFEDKDFLKVFVVLTIPTDMTRMTVNLKAPVIINIGKSRATQIILQERSYEVRTPAFDLFNRALAALQMNDNGFDQSLDHGVVEEVWSPVKVRNADKITRTSAEL